MDKCSCPLAGYCERRQMHINSIHWQQCQAGRVGHVDSVYAALKAARATRIRNAAPHPIADPTAFLEYTRALWAEVHTFPFTNNWACDARCKWWTDWLARVPYHGCSCKQKFKKILKDLPPDWSTREAFFYRTVDWHNAVNQSLDPPKPVWEHDTALVHWRAIAES